VIGWLGEAWETGPCIGVRRQCGEHASEGETKSYGNLSSPQSGGTSLVESPEIRRRTMQAVKSKDTVPEMVVRRLVYRMGYRYRLHRDELPGKPDLVFPRLRCVIFVHGCFWHGHTCARGNRVPKNNRPYWVRKIGRNKLRDQENISRLKAQGWRSLVVWECDLRQAGKLERNLRSLLTPKAPPGHK
jgi:DNA mismatch endonuclease (patch repair protein)